MIGFYKKIKRGKNEEDYIFFGVIFLSIIILLNIIYTATLDSSEHITITFNSLIYIAGLVIVGALLYFGSKLLDKYLYNNEARTK